MKKIALIIKREYGTRIRNKTFLLTTFLTPLLFIGIIAVSVYMSTNNSEDLKIAVYDETGLFARNLQSSKNIEYVAVLKPVFDSFSAKSPVGDYNGVLYVPVIDWELPKGIEYISEQQLGIFSQAKVDDDLNEVLEKERMVLANIDTSRLAAIKKNPISISQQLISEDNENLEANAGVASAVGYVSGMLIYMLMFIYGSMVMRGIMEEKISRVAEVMVSSVRPFQLMFGKIIGIGAVGLTQFLIWVVLILIGTTVFGSVVAGDDIQQMANAAQGKAAAAQEISGAMQIAIKQLNIPLLIGAFLFYFIFGYLFYAALFAAVGSAVSEDIQEAQSMMLPITIPIIFSFVAMSSAISNPTGDLAVWCSIIPFTSPIIMMARLPFGFPGTVAWWELGLSVICMVGGFLFTTWLSAKIYRTGILMYGKKASWKEMMQWAFRRG